MALTRKKLETKFPDDQQLVAALANLFSLREVLKLTELSLRTMEQFPSRMPPEKILESMNETLTTMGMSLECVASIYPTARDEVRKRIEDAKVSTLCRVSPFVLRPHQEQG